MRVRAAGSASNSHTAAASSGGIVHDAHGAALDQQRAMSAELKLCGPARTGNPSAAGSSRLWPPMGTSCRRRRPRRRPHRTTAARRAYRPGRPRFRRRCRSALLRVTKRTPRLFSQSATSSKRGGWRGTSTSSACAKRARTSAMRGRAARLPRPRACCPPPTPGGPCRAGAAASRPAPRCSGGRRKSNLMLPTTCVRSELAPMERNRSASSLALRGDEDAVRQRLAEQPDQAAVTLHRARRDARAGQHQRHAQPAAAVVEVRPDLGFEDHGQRAAARARRSAAPSPAGRWARSARRRGP